RDGLAALRQALSEHGVLLRNEPGDEETLDQLRAMYEPYTQVLSNYLMMPLPTWTPMKKATDNWQTSAWEVTRPAPELPFRKCMLSPHKRVHASGAAAVGKQAD